jgi:predicted nucleic acid-binding Zn ribbon protein
VLDGLIISLKLNSMAFRTVSDVLKLLQARGHWQTPPLQILLKSWHDIVGSSIALHTRPISIHRDVLRVATSSAAWAQTLTFERKTLLIKVNQKLSAPLNDIHFSTAGWNSSTRIIKPRRASHQEHPCYLEQNISNTVEKDVPAIGSNAVNTAFDSWVKKVQTSSQNLPLCPQCQSPTPSGELERWGVCALCAAKRF